MEPFTIGLVALSGAAGVAALAHKAPKQTLHLVALPKPVAKAIFKWGGKSITDKAQATAIMRAVQDARVKLDKLSSSTSFKSLAKDGGGPVVYAAGKEHWKWDNVDSFAAWVNQGGERMFNAAVAQAKKTGGKDTLWSNGLDDVVTGALGVVGTIVAGPLGGAAVAAGAKAASNVASGNIGGALGDLKGIF